MNFGLGIWWWGAKYFQNPRGILGVFLKELKQNLKQVELNLKVFPQQMNPRWIWGWDFLKSLRKPEASGIKCKGLHELSCLWGSCFVIPTEILEFSLPRCCSLHPQSQKCSFLEHTTNSPWGGCTFILCFTSGPSWWEWTVTISLPKCKSPKWITPNQRWMWEFPLIPKVFFSCLAEGQLHFLEAK